MVARDNAEYKGLLDGRIHLLIRVATIIIACFPMTRHVKRRLPSVLGPVVRNPLRSRGRLERRHRGTLGRWHSARLCRLIIPRRVQDGLIVLGGVPHLRILEIVEILVSRHRGTLRRCHRGRLDRRHRGTLRTRHRARLGRLIIPRSVHDGLIVVGGVPHLRILVILEILVSRHRGTFGRWYRARLGRLIMPRIVHDGLIVVGGVPYLRILEIPVSRHRGILETPGRNHHEILRSRHRAAQMYFIDFSSSRSRSREPIAAAFSFFPIWEPASASRRSKGILVSRDASFSLFLSALSPQIQRRQLHEGHIRI
jgi:hypothetical protein